MAGRADDSPGFYTRLYHAAMEQAQESSPSVASEEIKTDQIEDTVYNRGGYTAASSASHSNPASPAPSGRGAPVGSGPQAAWAFANMQTVCPDAVENQSLPVPEIPPVIITDGKESARWHADSQKIGRLFEDNHKIVMQEVKMTAKKYRDDGTEVKPLRVLLEDRLRTGGRHSYVFRLELGSLGKPGGLGFVFSDVLQHGNISEINSIFLDVHGRLRHRYGRTTTTLGELQMPLQQGVEVRMTVDLDTLAVEFTARYSKVEAESVTAVIYLLESVPFAMKAGGMSGYFMAVVQGKQTLTLH